MIAAPAFRRHCLGGKAKSCVLYSFGVHGRYPRVPRATRASRPTAIALTVADSPSPDPGVSPRRPPTPRPPPGELALLLTLAAVQFTHIVDFMILMPLGPQLMRILDIG